VCSPDDSCQSSLHLGITSGRASKNGSRSAANRNLFNKLLGQLYYCLQARQLFDGAKAFPISLGGAA